MRFAAASIKTIFAASALLSVAAVSSAQAAVLVPTNHATFDESVSPETVYFRVSESVLLAGTTCNGAVTYPVGSIPLSVTSATSYLWFTIRAESSLADIRGGAGTAVIKAELASSNTAMDLVDSNGTTPATATEVDYGALEQDTKTFGIKLTSFCSTAHPTIPNCVEGIPGGLNSATINIGLVGTGSSLSAANADKVQVNVVLADCPPHSTTALTTPSLNFMLIPGDSRIKLVNVSTAPPDQMTLSKVVVFAQKDSTTPTTGATVKAEFGNSVGEYMIEGLLNDNQYCFGLGYVNKGGFMSTNGTLGSTNFPFAAGVNAAGTICATPSQVDGFLNRSTCFIASAAYDGEWDPRLEVLRQFRDQILTHSKIGRAFEAWYYDWSPGAAHWIFENPGYKTIIRMALVPVFEGAKVALWIRSHMWIFGALLLAGITLLIVINRDPENEAT